MAVYLMSVTLSPGFTSAPTLKPVCFSFSIRMGLAVVSLFVFEELVSHGVAHLCIFPAGLCPEIGTAAGRTGTQYVPYFQVWQIGIVYYIPVKDGHE